MFTFLARYSSFYSALLSLDTPVIYPPLYPLSCGASLSFSCSASLSLSCTSCLFLPLTDLELFLLLVSSGNFLSTTRFMAVKTRETAEKPVTRQTARRQTRKDDDSSNTNSSKTSNQSKSTLSKASKSKVSKTQSKVSETSPTKSKVSKRASTKGTPRRSLESTISSPSKSKGPLIISEDDIASITDNQDLAHLVNSLVNTTQDELFSKYKAKVQAQMQADHKLIQELYAQLEQRDKPLMSSKPDLSYQSPLSDLTFQSPIRKKRKTDSNAISQHQMTKELENIGFTLDMLELLTGVRVLNFQEDDHRYYFDVKQLSGDHHINYRLVVSKTFETTAEIHYVPTFLEALEEGYEPDPDESMVLSEIVANAQHLKNLLPDYLCENLSFPYNTLAQFYGKVSRALGKRR